VIKETGDISVLTQLCQFGIVNFEVQFKLFSDSIKFISFYIGEAYFLYLVSKVIKSFAGIVAFIFKGYEENKQQYCCPV
jgi:hypothetical protein